MTASRREEARVAREVTARAIRRLDVLEWVILAGAAGLAVVGGFVVAMVLGSSLGWAFRPTWTVASVLLFGVPGVIIMIRRRREDRGAQRDEEHG